MSKEKWQWIVWVGSVDDYYTDFKRAKQHADEWTAKGHDDVIIEKIVVREENVSATLTKVKEHCQAEVQINEEYPWENITDGTEWISRGRLEFAEELLNQIKTWEEEHGV